MATEGPFWANVHHANIPQGKVPQVNVNLVVPGKSYSTVPATNPTRDGE